MSDFDTSDIASQHRQERCQAVHDAIRNGRTTLPPIGRMTDDFSGVVLEMRTCPHCRNTFSQVIRPTKEVAK